MIPSAPDRALNGPLSLIRRLRKRLLRYKRLQLSGSKAYCAAYTHNQRKQAIANEYPCTRASLVNQLPQNPIPSRHGTPMPCSVANSESPSPCK